MTFCPPHWYYTEKVLHPKEEIDQVIKDFEAIPLDKHDNLRTTWCRKDGIKHPEKIWHEKYDEIIANIVCQLGLYKMFYYSYHFWAQLYKKGQAHGTHNHFGPNLEPDATISLVHFIRNSNEKNFTFVNEDTNQIYKPKQEEGDIIIFPSYLYHKVTPNTSDLKRFVVALNITLEK